MRCLALLVILAATPAALAQAPLPPQAPPVQNPTFGLLLRESVQDSKPIAVFVGYRCQSTELQLPGWLHLHTELGGRGITEPSVSIHVPWADGYVYKVGTVSADRCCAAELKAAVKAAVTRWSPGTIPTSLNWSPGATGAATPTPPRSGSRLLSHLSHLVGWTTSTNGQCAG